MTAPEVRALLVQNNLLALDRLGPVRRDRVVARWGALDEVTSVSRLAWLPVHFDVDLAVALDAEIGTNAVRQWAREGLERTMEAPMLRALVDGALRLFASSPGGAYRWVCRGWTVLFRHCGTLEIASSDARSCTLVIKDPAREIRVRPYLQGMASSLSLPLQLFQAEGTVLLEEQSDEIRFFVHWRPLPRRVSPETR
jgi:hypothetical protein